MQIRNAKIVSTRVIILIANFIINIYLAHRILFDLGQDFFAYYAILVALPALIPFADLGLGASVFNLYVDHQDNEKLDKQISKVYFISIIGCLIQICIFSLFIIVFFHYFIAENFDSSQTRYWAVSIIVITYIAVPFSLASKKLQAESRNQETLKIQGLIPILNLSGYLLARNIIPGSPTFIALIPAFSYLLTNIVIYSKSQIWKNIIWNYFFSQRIEIKRDLRLGFWVIIFSGITAVSWQVPKYYFSFRDSPSMVTNYTIFLMIVMAAFSIIQLPALSVSPSMRRNPRSSVLILKKEFGETLLVGALLSLGFITLFRVLNITSLLLLDSKFVMLTAIVIAVSPIWVLPLNTFSYSNQFKLASFVLGASLCLTIGFLLYFEEREFWALVYYLGALNIIFSTSSWAIHAKMILHSKNESPD